MKVHQYYECNKDYPLGFLFVRNRARAHFLCLKEKGQNVHHRSFVLGYRVSPSFLIEKDLNMLHQLIFQHR